MNLFFDTETTGLPQKEHNWQTDYNHFPHIVSIAWKFGERENYFILNQEGRSIPAAATKINGITNRMANESLHTFGKIIPKFLADAMQAEKVIAHNTYFDTSVIKANVLREFAPDSPMSVLSIEALDKTKRMDTLRMAVKMKMGWLKLSELYYQLFGDDGYEFHNALMDIRAVERIYNELLKLQQLKITKT